MSSDSASEGDASADKPADVRIDTQITSGREASEDGSDSSGDGGGLPFRLLLVSDLTPEASAAADWATEDRRHLLGGKSASDLMAELGPQLTVEVPNRLGNEPETWTVSLSFPTLEAFAPAPVAEQVGPTARLLEARALVQAVRDEAMDEATFREQLNDIDMDVDWADDLYRLLADGEASAGATSTNGTPSADEAAEDDALGRVMDMVDTNGAAADSSPSADVDEGTPADEGAAADRILDRLDEAIGAQVEAVLSHPDVRRLEAAWRGVFFLEDRIDLKGDVELVVLPAGRDDLHEALHHQVLVPEHNEANDDPPISLVMVDQAFGRSHVDIEQLADLAGTGESLQAPVVASVGADFFGLEHLRGLSRLPALRPHLQGDEYVEWKRLRSEDAASFLGLTLPSLKLRAPHRPASTPSPVSVNEGNALYGSGALAVGVAAARSMVETSWPTHLGRPSVDGALSVQFEGSMQSELARAGFTVLSETGDGAVTISHAPSVREPAVYDDPAAAAEARMEASLPCRLFVARAAHRLFALRRELDLTAPLDDLQMTVADEMAAFLGVDTRAGAPEADEPDADEWLPVRVEHETEIDLPNQEVLAVRLRPPDRILTANARLAMALRVPSGN